MEQDIELHISEVLKLTRDACRVLWCLKVSSI